MDVLLIERLLDQNKPDQALQELSLRMLSIKDDPRAYFNHENLILRALLLKGDYDRVISRAKLLLQQKDIHQFPLEKSLIQIWEYEAKWKTIKDVTLLQEFQKKYHAFLKATKHDSSVKKQTIEGLFLFRLGSMKLDLHNLHEALEMLLKSNAIFKKLDYSLGISKSYTNIAVAYWMKGELDNAREHFMIALEKAEHLQNLDDITRINYNLGVLALSKGALNLGHKHLQQAYEGSKTLGLQKRTVLVLNSLGSISYERGELEDALQYYHEALKILQKGHYDEMLFHVLNNLGITYQAKGKLELAMDYFLQAKEFLEKHETRNIDVFSLLLYNMILLELEQGKVNEAKTSLHEFSTLMTKAGQTEISLIKIRYQVAQALILKASDRIIDRAQAQEQLEKLSQVKIPDNSVQRNVHLHLCELLFFEIKTLGNEKAMKKLIEQVTKLKELAIQEHMMYLTIHVHILEAKIMLIQENYNGALQHLLNAQTLAEEHGFINLSILSSKILDELVREYGKWHQLYSVQASITEKAKQLDFDVTLTEILTPKTSWKTEELKDEPEVFIIFNENLEVMYARYLKHEKNTHATTDKIIYQLSQLRADLKSKIDAKHDRWLLYNQNMILLVRDKHLQYVYVFKGDSYPATQKINAFLEALQLNKKIYEILNQSIVKSDKPLTNYLDRLLTDLFIGDGNVLIKLDEDQHGLLQVQKEPGKTKTTSQHINAKELLHFKKLFHPIKIAIMKLLYQNYKLSAADLRALLGVPWGNFETHYKTLQNLELIEVRTEFEEAQPKSFFYITKEGLKEYKELSETLKAIL